MKLNACYIGTTGMTKETCLPRIPVAAQSLQNLLLQQTPQIDRCLRITHRAHTSKQWNKIRNNHQTISTAQNRDTKLIYTSRQTHGYKER